MKDKIVELIKLKQWNNVKYIIQKEKFLDDEVMGHLVEAHKWTLIRFFVENGGYLSQKIAISLAKSGQRDLIIFCIKKGAIGVFSQELLLVFTQTHQWKAMILAISKGGGACCYSCYKIWLELAKSCQWYILEQCFKNGNTELKSDEIEIIEAFESLLVNSGKENLVILYIEHFLFRKFSDDITSKEVSEMIKKARTFPFYKIFPFGKVWRFLTDNTLELIMFHGQWNALKFYIDHCIYLSSSMLKKIALMKKWDILKHYVYAIMVNHCMGYKLSEEIEMLLVRGHQWKTLEMYLSIPCGINIHGNAVFFDLSVSALNLARDLHLYKFLKEYDRIINERKPYEDCLILFSLISYEKYCENYKKSKEYLEKKIKQFS